MLLAPWDMKRDLLVLADLYQDEQLNQIQGDLRQCETEDDLYFYLTHQTTPDLIHIYTGACKQLVAGHTVNFGNDQRSVAAMAEHVLTERTRDLASTTN